MKKLTNEKKVIKVLAENPGIKPADIGRIARVRIKSLYGVLYKLVRNGTVVRKNRGAFYLAEGVKVDTPELTPVRSTPDIVVKRIEALNKENEQLIKDNERLLEAWRETSVELFDTRAVVTYLESKLKEAYGNAGKQG